MGSDALTDLFGLPPSVQPYRGDLPVFRATATDPSVVFTRGFPARGVNTAKISRSDIKLYQVTGEGSYGFRSASDDLAAARRIAAGGQGWCYVIYSYCGMTGPAIDVNATLGAASRYPLQKEVVFPGGIRPEDIHSAYPITGFGSTDVDSPVPNPHYQPSPASLTPPPAAMTPEAVGATVAGVFGPVLADLGYTSLVKPMLPEKVKNAGTDAVVRCGIGAGYAGPDGCAVMGLASLANAVKQPVTDVVDRTVKPALGNNPIVNAVLDCSTGSFGGSMIFGYVDGMVHGSGSHPSPATEQQRMPEPTPRPAPSPTAEATTPTPGTGGRQPAPWKALHDGATAALTTVGNLLRTGDAAGTGCATFSWCGLQRAFGAKTR